MADRYRTRAAGGLPVAVVQRPGPRDGLPPAAADVAHALEQLAMRHPRASAPGLVLLLARRYCPAMLRRKWRP